MSFHVFGNWLVEKSDFTADHIGTSHSGTLVESYSRKVTLALKDEFHRAGRLYQFILPEFTDLRHLSVQHKQSAQKHAGIENALVCATQLCKYIRYGFQMPQHIAAKYCCILTNTNSIFEQSSHSEPCNKNKHFVAFGIGGFAAIAAATSDTPVALVSNAVRATLLVFRIGTFVHSMTRDILQPGTETARSASWAYELAVTRDLALPHLARFHKEQVSKPKSSVPAQGKYTNEFDMQKLPLTRQAYISCITPNGIELSGHPETLEKLFLQKHFAASPVPLPVYGLYTAVSVYEFVKVSDILHFDGLNMQGTLHSPVILSTGTWSSGRKTSELLTCVAEECLKVAPVLHAAFDQCISAALCLKNPECHVLSYGPASITTALVSSFRENTKLSVITHGPCPEPLANLELHDPSSNHRKLAVVGMSGRFPDAQNHDELWELLCDGIDVHRPIPKDRFSIDTYVDTTGKAKNTSYTPYGCWIQNAGFFDTGFFNMSPREAAQTDPMQRLAILTAYEALEMSGYVPNRTPSTQLDRVGTFYGQTSDDWRETNASQNIDTYYIPGGIRAFGPGRINYFFGFSGPSMSIDTACSSSGTSLQVACTSLLAGDCDTAVVGGLSILSNPDLFSGLCRGQFLSKTGPCATFDDKADGYCRADGCATVIVKRLEDAIADKDNILGVILGAATNHSADARSITHPHGPTQAALFTKILNAASVDALDVDYVEMHGTGTQAGDSTEMGSVTDVFAPVARKRPSDRPLYLGAVKSNIGHGEAAAGVTSLIKSLLILQHNMIPPHIGIKPGSVINTQFPKDLLDRSVTIPFEMTPFARQDRRRRRIFVNNFSAAGGNTGVLLEDGPSLAVERPDPRSCYVVTITAKTKQSMVKNARNLLSWLDRNPETPLAHMAYTTTARRMHYKWRMSCAVSTTDNLRDSISAKLSADDFSVLPSVAPRVVFVFTGQGSVYSGMGRELYDNYAVFRNCINNYEQIARIHQLPSFIALITSSEDENQYKETSPVAVQLALCCFEMALVQLWGSWGVRPQAVIGHSLGEYAALYAAGVFSASDTIYLVGMRATLLTKRCTLYTHAMLAVQASVASIKQALGSDDMITCVNSPSETVLGGTVYDISIAAQKLGDLGFKCVRLSVPYAFHTNQVDPILDELETIAQSIKFCQAQVPVTSSYRGTVLEDESLDASYIREQTRRPVKFLPSILSLLSSTKRNQTNIWVEVGPHAVCTSIIKAVIGDAAVAEPSCRRNESAHKVLCKTLGRLYVHGLDINWDAFHHDFSNSVKLLALPSYSFNEKNYWIPLEGNRSPRAKRMAPKIAHQKPLLSTTTVHRVTKETVNGSVALVETETDIHRDDIKAIIMGHRCNGVPLCPSSLYADIAMTTSDYAIKLLQPSVSVGLDVGNLRVTKPLLLTEEGASQLLHCEVKTEVAAGFATVTIFSGQGSYKLLHATCRVVFGSLKDWKTEFEGLGPPIKARIDAMTEERFALQSCKISRSLAYRLFSSLVDYSYQFQGMEEIFLQSQTCEATAKITFKTTQENGSFFFNPYWIDSCCHLSGFILNGTDAAGSHDQAFISHGWESFRFIEALQEKGTYQAYACMLPKAGTKQMVGDVYVFSGDRLVGIAGEVIFQAIPRRFLDTILPPSKPLPSIRVGVPNNVELTRASADVRNGPGKHSSLQDISDGAPKQQAKANSTSITAGFMKILQTEMGDNSPNWDRNTSFVELGCDSLMALNVTSRLREELHIEVDSLDFFTYPTLGKFQTYLTKFEYSTASQPKDAPAECKSAQSKRRMESPRELVNALTRLGDAPIEIVSIKPGTDINQGEILYLTIAEEIGIDREELEASSDLAELGMDSLMILSILGALQDRLGRSIPVEWLTSSRSMSDIERAFGLVHPSYESDTSQDQPSISSSRTAASGREVRDAATIGGRPAIHVGQKNTEQKATAVLLQGNTHMSTRNLFIFPDGGGSATSYKELGHISDDWAVWGLSSPFIRTPDNYKCGIKGIASIFIEEIRRRQSIGPYSFAGWSVGGAIAYESTVQLMLEDECVEHLILIDAPCPLIREPLPKDLPVWFAEIGLVGLPTGSGGKHECPQWLLSHFSASSEALYRYQPSSMALGKCPKVLAIWCEDGVCKNDGDPRPDPYPTGHAEFLLENRTDFGYKQWDTLLDVSRFEIAHVPGNHFTMMRGEPVSTTTHTQDMIYSEADRSRQNC